MVIGESARQIHVRDEVDVLVVGGGVSGCSAAGAAAALSERTGTTGRELDVRELQALLSEQGLDLARGG